MRRTKVIKIMVIYGLQIGVKEYYGDSTGVEDALSATHPGSFVEARAHIELRLKSC